MKKIIVFNDPSEITSKASLGTPDGGFLGFLRTVAVIAVVVGAVGSVGSMLVEGHPPMFLRILFTIWVLSPFVALVLANMVSKRWSVTTRATLYCVMLVVTLTSLAIYGYFVLRPHESTPTFVFLVVPLGSWLLIAIVVPMAAFISGRRSSRRAMP